MATTTLFGLRRSLCLWSRCRYYGSSSLFAHRPLLASQVQRQVYSTENAASVIVEPEADSGVVVLKMDRKPVNSLNLELMTEVTLALEKLEGDKSCSGVILTSANPGVFSAGLDITEMYQPQEARLREFWRMLQELFLRLYGSGLITMAAINGHAPAGGCLLSISCDYRVMASPKFTIGLNETQLLALQVRKRSLKAGRWIGDNITVNGGEWRKDFFLQGVKKDGGRADVKSGALLGIVPPFWFTDAMLNTIGHRQSEYALQMGRMFSSDEALQVGLVDQLADIGEVFATARKEMDKWLKVPGVARQLTKSGLRNPTLQKLISRRDQDIDHFINFITKDTVQKSLGMYIESLKKRKS